MTTDELKAMVRDVPDFPTEGIVFKEADFGSSTAFRVSDGIAYEHPGKYTAVGPFEYSSA